MLRKHILCLVLILVSLSGFGQKELFFPKMDSIPLEYRSDGVPLDSVDALVTGKPNLRPGGGNGQLYEFNLPENLFVSPAGFSYLMNSKKVTPKFSGLPYLGFQYAFGSALTQDLNVEYQQFFKPNTHLHFRYNRQTSNGFLRNSKYKLNDVNLRFYHQKGIFTTHLDGFFGSYDIAENGGMVTDSLIENFGLEFTPVRKSDAESKTRNLDLKWDNYFKLAGDSLTRFGLKTKHRLEILNRKYMELFIENSMYDTLYLDTTGNTYDQYQTAKITSGAGFYFDSPHFKADATLNHQYWKNKNPANDRDTNEIALHSNLWVSLGERLTLHNEFYFNLIGATGEIKEHAKVDYKILKSLSLEGEVNFENLFPEPYLRSNTSNYYQWEIENLKMQQKLQVKGSLKYGDANFVKASVSWTSINNGRYFIDNQWRQDTLELVSVAALNLKGAYRLKKWSFYPSATVRFNSKNFSYQPLFSTLNRIAFTTKMFKAQKLGLSVGVDVGYHTGYQFMAYNGVLGLLGPVQTSVQTPSLMQLNAFFALSIDQFRFFVKAENISSLYQDETARIDVGYPIMPLILRLGITWDFFN